MLMKTDIDHLSELARLAISDKESNELAAQLDSVLAYVGEISKVATQVEVVPRAGELRNILREDGDAYEGGEWTEQILANAPHKEDGYFKVEQIL